MLKSTDKKAALVFLIILGFAILYLACKELNAFLSAQKIIGNAIDCKCMRFNIEADKTGNACFSTEEYTDLSEMDPAGYASGIDTGAYYCGNHGVRNGIEIERCFEFTWQIRGSKFIFNFFREENKSIKPFTMAKKFYSKGDNGLYEDDKTRYFYGPK